VSYVQLFRLPNIFTAVADVTMGYLFVRESLAPAGTYVGLALASCLLYTAGMVLNDVYDVQTDRRERTGRPLPSGRILVSRATGLGYGMLVTGLASAWLAGYFDDLPSFAPWRSGAVGTLLVLAIVSYDVILKNTAAGPVIMGMCRLLNVLLGMSLGAPLDQNVWQFVGYDGSQLCVAGGIGLYIVGVTVLARTEAVESNRRALLFATGLMVSGLVALAAFPQFGVFAAGLRPLVVASPIVWPMLVLLLGFSIVRRCATTIVDPSAARVQIAVKQCILSLIVLDAAVCLAVRQPAWWSVGILSLLVPTIILGRWAYST
jgi:4-hydroxybenzoate polyprenyltransferase